MARRDATQSAREGATKGLSSFLSSERGRLLDRASDERREQLRAAERQRAVFRAWNEVCANTREGQHVTGLKYLPATNELLVYVEAGSWATELSMVREVIRARMAVKGVDVADLIFKTSRAGYTPVGDARGAKRSWQHGLGAKPAKTNPIPTHRLSEAEEKKLDSVVAPIEDRKLKEALRSAMGASLAWQTSKKSNETPKQP